MSRFLVVILILMLNANLLISQERRINFTAFSTKQGLSYPAINDILQDKNGMLWIATNEGLNKFDGYTFDNFFSRIEANGFNDNTFLSVIQSPDNNIWAITKFGGLKLLDMNSLEILTHPLDSDQIITRENGHLFLTSKNKIFVKGKNGMLILENDKLKLFNKDKILPMLTYLVYEDTDKNIWLASSAGIYRSKDTSHLEFDFYPFYSDFKDKMKNTISTIYRFDENTLLLGSFENGLLVYNSQVKNFVEIKLEIETEKKLFVTAMVTDELGYLWVGTYGSGIYILKKQGNGFEVVQHHTAGINPGSLPSNGINCLFRDKSGVIWVGTQDAGLLSYSPRKSLFPLYSIFNSQFMKDDHTNTFYVDKEGAWYIGTDSKGVVKYWPGTNDYKIYSDENSDIKISSKFVNGIYKDSEGFLWVATFGDGLFRINESTRKVEKIELKNNKNYTSNNRIVNIIPTSDECFWICTMGSGLWHYNPKTKKTINYSPEEVADVKIKSSRMWHIYQQDDSILWIAHNTNGLEKLNLRTGKSIIYEPNYTNDSIVSIPSNCIIQILPSPVYKNELWLATKHGLSKFDTYTNKFTNYSRQNGLPGTMIASIQFDKSNKLWIGTNNGLAQMDTETGKINTYNESYGLQSLNFVYLASYHTPDGLLFFGGNNGFNAFYPNKLRSDDYVPEVIISKFYIFNNLVLPVNNSPLKAPIEETQTIHLNYNQNFFAFEFTTSDFSDPLSIRYFYKLEGFEDQWHQDKPNSRFASYTNVQPGTYTFKVKYTNANGHMTENTREIKIIISPPFWMTVYFISAAIVFVLILIWIVFRIRLKTLERNNKLLEKKVADRTSELTKKTSLLEQSQFELKKLSLVASSTSNAVSIIDLNGNLYWTNKAFQHVYQLDNNKQYMADIACNIHNLRPHPLFSQYFEACRNNNTAHFFESEIRTIDGKIIPVNSNIIPLLNDSMNLVQIIIVDTDLTHIKLAQHQIELQRDELLKSNATKDKLFSIIAHDLRSPIGNISKFLDLLVHYPDTLDNSDEIIRTMDKTAKATYNLLENLLIWSRSQRNEIGYHPGLYPIDIYVNETKHLLQGMAINKNISISNNTNPEQTAWFDENLLRIIIRNLISNAIKFTNTNGHVKINAQIRNQFLEITVSDNGIGMDAETLKKMFKVDSHFTTFGTAAEKGQGLGLLLCKDLVEICKGQIWVESDVNIGSKFHFSLPLSNPLLNV